MNIEKVKELARIAHEKRERFKCLAMVNANQPTFEEREALAIDYEAARAEMFEADANLLKEQYAQPTAPPDKPVIITLALDGEQTRQANKFMNRINRL